MKKQGTCWTLVVWTIKMYTCSPRISSSRFLHAVVRAWRSRMSDSCSAFPFICASCVSSGVDGKLRMAVDGDAGQVVPDDLVDCGGGKERKGRSVYQTLFYKSPYWVSACAMCHVISLESNNWLLAVIVPEHFWFHIFCTNHNLETSESKPEDRELSAHAVRTLARSNFNQISISKFPSTTVKEIISCWSIMISSRWRQFPRKKKHYVTAEEGATGWCN